MDVLITHKESLKSGRRCQKIYIFNALKRKSHTEKEKKSKRNTEDNHQVTRRAKEKEAKKGSKVNPRTIHKMAVSTYQELF